MDDDRGSSWIGADRDSLDDLWRVYEPEADAIQLATMEAIAPLPAFAAAVAARPLSEAAAESVELLRRGIAGDWSGYEARLRQQGKGYAQRRVPFGSWYEVMRVFQRLLRARLVRAYGHDAARTTRALEALQAFVDRSLAVVGEEYLATKERSLHEQRWLAEVNEARYRMLFDNSPVPMWVYDRESHKFLAVNRATVEKYGYAETELLGMTIDQIRFPEDLPLLAAEELRSKQAQLPNDIGQWRHRKKDGSAIWVELQLQHTLFGGRSAHLIVATDVTVERQARASLEASEERYRSVVAATSQVVWSVDGEGRVTAPQPSWQAYTGQEPARYEGVGWLDAIHPDDRARVVATWRSGVRAHEFEGRLWHAASNGYHYFVARAVPLTHADGSLREWIGTITDVDERKRAEQPGRFFTLSLDLLCIAGADGYFKRLNPAFKILGYSEEELLARPFVEFVHPDDRAHTTAQMEALARGEPVIQFENRYQCRDGSYRDLVWSAAPDPTAGVIYAVARDITDRKRIEAERLELNRLLLLRNEELMRAGRAKSDFLAMMSHELRTPLNSIIGFSEVLIDGKFGPLNDKQLRYQQNVHGSGRHLLGLINDLLDLSKVEAGRFEIVRQACAARTVAAEAIITLMPLAQARNVDLGLEPQPPGIKLPPVSADAGRFKQVLYNLLSNAIKFTPPGGRVRVTCAVAPRPGFVRVTVHDTGSGIVSTDVSLLFQPFSQLANGKERGGTGLGLALSKQFVELMGGEIGVTSAPGQGSAFYVDLPLHEAPPAAPAVAPRSPLVLVVQGEAARSAELVQALQAGGYRTATARSGEAALAAARRERPDVITVDALLPPVDGWDVRRLLALDPDTTSIPLVLVALAGDQARAVEPGAIDHLVKPVRRDDLLAALSRLRFGPKVRRGTVSVLAIDDDPAHLELVRATLEPQGFLVRTATSGQAGLTALLADPADLILLDLVMPDLSGLEVVSRLRADPRTRALPVLLLSGHALSAAERERIDRDVAAILDQGVTTSDALVQAVARVLERRPATP